MVEIMMEWTDCIDDMPIHKQKVLIQLDDETMLDAVFLIATSGTCCCFKTAFGFFQSPQVVAWQSKPKPYKNIKKKQKRGADK